MALLILCRLLKSSAQLVAGRFDQRVFIILIVPQVPKHDSSGFCYCFCCFCLYSNAPIVIYFEIGIDAAIIHPRRVRVID